MQCLIKDRGSCRAGSPTSYGCIEHQAQLHCRLWGRAEGAEDQVRYDRKAERRHAHQVAGEVAGV